MKQIKIITCSQLNHPFTHIHAHTHNRFTALLDSVWDYLGEPAPES